MASKLVSTVGTGSHWIIETILSEGKGKLRQRQVKMKGTNSAEGVCGQPEERIPEVEAI